MRAPETTTIDGRAYRVSPLPAGEGLKILTMLTKALAPGLANVSSVAAIAAEIGELIAGVATNLDEAQVDRLARTMAGATLVEKTPGGGDLIPLRECFDVHFAGDFGAMVAWMGFALRVNYGPLVDSLKARMPSAPAPAASAAPAA